MTKLKTKKDKLYAVAFGARKRHLYSPLFATKKEADYVIAKVRKEHSRAFKKHKVSLTSGYL